MGKGLLKSACINARRARATAFPYKGAPFHIRGREGGLSEPRARLVNKSAPRQKNYLIKGFKGRVQARAAYVSVYINIYMYVGKAKLARRTNFSFRLGQILTAVQACLSRALCPSNFQIWAAVAGLGVKLSWDLARLRVFSQVSQGPSGAARGTVRACRIIWTTGSLGVDARAAR